MDSSKCSTSTHILTLVILHYGPWFPFSLSAGDLASINDLHQWLVIKWWTTMFDLNTSIHIVGHVLVAVCVEDLPDWWHLIYATSLIVPVFMRFQLSWLDSIVCQISSAIMEILILCISSSWRFWSMYIIRGNDHLCDILYHAYSWPLYSYVSGTAMCMCSYMQSCIMVLCWLGGWSSIWDPSSLHFWDGLIMYFGHRMTPQTSQIRGHLL